MIHLNTHEIKNPDIADWNAFKESLSSLHYCIKLVNDQEIQKNLIEMSVEENLNQGKYVQSRSYF